MKYFLIFLFFLNMVFVAFNAEAQHEGDTWVIGYSYDDDQGYSIMHLDFTKDEMTIHWHFDEKMFLFETASNICNANGEAVLWTNGMQIFGRNGVYIADTIAYSEGELSYWNWYNEEGIGPLGFPIHDGAIILPVPDADGEFSVIYHFFRSISDLGLGANRYLEARVKLNLDSTYTLIYKDSLIGMHEFYSGTIVSTRHANGRDWWIVFFEASGPNYFTYLLEPKGIRLHHQGKMDIDMKEGVGQAAYSSSGNFIARMDAINFDEPQYINLFNFDRCTGNVEHLETFNTDAGYFTGVAFSPSEQYLYADNNTHLWQWDLWAEDIGASQTLVDTFDGFIQPGWFSMHFGPMMNAPDGRIYIVPPEGSSNFIHVIDRPDEPATDCRFLQHHINLKVPNGRSAPNLPNFRLGPLDGSSCDTLGINNVPVARWRFEEDQPGWRYDVRFTDLSFFDPQQWHWDFGDGETNDEVHPIHTFESGLYHVCLTVSNTYGQDSTCHWVEILPVSLEDDGGAPEDDLSIAPNPFTDKIEIRSKRGDIRTTEMTIYDMHGREMMSHAAAPVPVVLHVPSWPSGMYLMTIKEDDGRVYQFKVMKI